MSERHAKREAGARLKAHSRPKSGLALVMLTGLLHGMKLKQLLLPIGSALAMGAVTAGAQGWSMNVVGYVNGTFQPGDTWFGNPLDDPPNTLSILIPTAPTGTTVSLWNSTLNQYTPVSTFTGSGWSTDLTLNPGTGALLDTPSQFPNTFVGNVLDLNGALWDGLTYHEPAPFAEPNGLYLLSCMMPLSLSGDVFDPTPGGSFSVFESIIGRAPNDGEQVTTLDPLTQTYTTTTFLDGAWDNGAPSLDLGEAAMFNIISVPEPSALGLLAAGLGTLGIARRRLPSTREPEYEVGKPAPGGL
jgi:hypothetical protein